MTYIGSVKDGLSKLGEGVVDQLVDSFASNQETTLKQLQQIQSWGLVKAVQKAANSKFLGQEPNVIPVPDINVKRAVEGGSLYEWDGYSRPGAGCLSLCLEEGLFHKDSGGVWRCEIKWEQHNFGTSKVPGPGPIPDRKRTPVEIKWGDVVSGDLRDPWADVIIEVYNGKNEKIRGRTILPLALLFEDAVKVKEYVWNITLLVFPPYGQDAKFFRPVAGYPGFGMTNPGTAIGFLKLQVTWAPYGPSIGPYPINALIQPPSARWTNMKQFEPQFLETYAYRAKQSLEVPPRWIYKFFGLISKRGIRNNWDIACIIVFHLCTFLGLSFSPVLYLPLCVGGAVLSVSLTYRLGHHEVRPIRESLKLDVPNKQSIFMAERRRAWSESEGSSPESEDAVPVVPEKKSESLMTWWKDMVESTEKSMTSIMAEAEKLKPFDTGFPKIFKNKKSDKPDEKTMESTPSAPPAPPPTSKLAWHGITFDLCVSDPTNYFAPHFPVFADDAGEQDVQLFFDCASEMLDSNQSTAASIGMVSEKFSFAFNWEEPSITWISLAMLACIIGTSTITIYILQTIPNWYWRVPVATLLLIRLHCMDEVLSPLYMTYVHEPIANLLRLKKVQPEGRVARQNSSKVVNWPRLPSFKWRPSFMIWDTAKKDDDGENIVLDADDSPVKVIQIAARKQLLTKILYPILGVIELIMRFVIYWWIRLPDRREMEHRLMAKTQIISLQQQ